MASQRYEVRKGKYREEDLQGRIKGPSSSTSSMSPALDIAVYFKDKTAVQFSVNDGQNCQAGELFEMVMDEMNFPPVAHELFSLWLVSDFLEVQLRPSQVPFHLACFWVELLSKYTTVKIEDAEVDEPVIVFQRNVFYPLNLEQELIQEPVLLRLLYHEAKDNVLDDRYIFKSEEEYAELAGIQAFLAYRSFNESLHTPSFYRGKVSDFFPEPIHQKRKLWNLFGGVQSLQVQLTHSHRRAATTFNDLNLTNDEDRKQVYLAYLGKCWVLPFYGAAYFRGQIENPSRKGLMSSEDVPVFMGCNLQGIFILDMDSTEPLIHLSYKEFNWEYAEPSGGEQDSTSQTPQASNDTEGAMPCLFIYLKLIKGDVASPQLLQVFSKQCVMIDAILRGCLETNKSQVTTKSEMEPVLQNRQWQNLEKLVLRSASLGDEGPEPP